MKKLLDFLKLLVNFSNIQDNNLEPRWIKLEDDNGNYSLYSYLNKIEDRKMLISGIAAFNEEIDPLDYSKRIIRIFASKI